MIAADSAKAVNVTSLPTEDQRVIEAKLGTNVVGNALPSKPIEDPSAYFPLQESSAIYQVTAGPHVGNKQRLHVARVQRSNGKAGWKFEFSPRLTGYIQQTPDGDIIMPTIGDAREGIVIITTPASPFLIKGMNPGESRSYIQHVQVAALEDPADSEYSGSLYGQYTYLGTYQVTVPAGTYEAVLFRLMCHGKIGPVRTRDTAYYFFAPGKGIVAMISQEDAMAFWIIHLDTTSARVLAASDQN